MPESFASSFARFKFNLFPAYRGTGGRVEYISDDFREIRIKLPLSWRTRNYVGTIFGGSLYGAVDPILMIMLIKNLGKEFIVWDKSASIRFKRPGTETLYAEFRIGDAELDEIRSLLRDRKSVDRIYEVELKDADGKVCCAIQKTIYIARKQ